MENELIKVAWSPEGNPRPLVYANHLPPEKQEAAVKEKVAKLCSQGWVLIGYVKEMEDGNPFGFVAVMECTKEQYFGK